MQFRSKIKLTASSVMSGTKMISMQHLLFQGRIMLWLDFLHEISKLHNNLNINPLLSIKIFPAITKLVRLVGGF